MKLKQIRHRQITSHQLTQKKGTASALRLISTPHLPTQSEHIYPPEHPRTVIRPGDTVETGNRIRVKSKKEQEIQREQEQEGKRRES